MNYSKKTVISLLVILLLVFSLTAAAEITAAVTIVPQLEMVEAIAGEKIEVVEMIPKGFSPSNYAPSPVEMRAFNKAAVYFSIGVPADIQNILPRAEGMTDLKVIKLFEKIESKYPHRYFIEKNENKGGRDPHFWLSPSRTSYMVEIMRDQLIDLMPQHENEFRKNAANYLNKLNKINQENKKILSPYQGEEILAYHPAFGYFTEEYGLKMIAVEKSGKEPGPRHLQKIIETASQKGIKNVFYQEEIDSRKSKAVAEELGGTVVQLNPLAGNYLQNLKLMAEKIVETLAERDDNQ